MPAATRRDGGGSMPWAWGGGRRADGMQRCVKVGLHGLATVQHSMQPAARVCQQGTLGGLQDSAHPLSPPLPHRSPMSLSVSPISSVSLAPPRLCTAGRKRRSKSIDELAVSQRARWLGMPTMHRPQLASPLRQASSVSQVKARRPGPADSICNITRGTRGSGLLMHEIGT